MAYNPNQRRDRHGRFAPKVGGVGNPAGSIPKPKAPKSQSGRKTRGVGTKGLRSNFVPYARVNKRSQTVGYNAGTLIPGTHRRIVTGAYVRVESTKNKTVADRFVAKHAKRVFPEGSKRGKAARSLKNNVSVVNPALRASVKGHQVRLGTSRGAGPTVIVRRGKHKTPIAESVVGTAKYDRRMKAIAGKKAVKKKPRPQRRNTRKKK